MKGWRDVAVARLRQPLILFVLSCLRRGSFIYDIAIIREAL